MSASYCRITELTIVVSLKTFPEELKKLAAEGYKLDARIQNVADGVELAREYGL